MSNISIERQGLAGYITLHRPDALNSLTHEMISDIHAGIRLHEADDAVDIIVMRSSSDRAFCAGGDMKATRLLALDKQWDDLQQFFEQEYSLNLHIANCKKTYVSMVSGIAMGGGLGLSVHGDVMVVSETALLAMPETAIGFFPDVGGTYFLSRLPCNAGLWLALSGMPVKGLEAVIAGLATHYVELSNWPELLEAFETEGCQAVDLSLVSLSSNATDTEFSATLKQRQTWFDSANQHVLIQTLKMASVDNNDAVQLLQRIESMSPYAMELTRRLLLDAKKHDLAKCLQLELAAANEAVRHPDFVEGIRAVLVDKDNANWANT